MIHSCGGDSCEESNISIMHVYHESTSDVIFNDHQIMILHLSQPSLKMKMDYLWQMVHGQTSNKPWSLNHSYPCQYVVKDKLYIPFQFSLCKNMVISIVHNCCLLFIFPCKPTGNCNSRGSSNFCPVERKMPGNKKVLVLYTGCFHGI